MRVLVSNCKAMLNKTLVVATNGGGHDEIIKHGTNGIIAHSDDPKDFSKFDDLLFNES